MIARRGRLQVFDRFAPDKTALLVVDMQNYFVDMVPLAKSIVPNINRLAAACRDRGCTIVWITTTLAESEDAPSLWPLYHDNFFSKAMAETHKRSLTPGHDGHALFSDLDVKAVDMHVDKRRFSSFIDGASDLRSRLQALGVENLIVTGTLTNTCCESTARDAMMLDYKVAFVEDATAARSDEEHVAALVSLVHGFADVRNTSDTIALVA